MFDFVVSVIVYVVFVSLNDICIVCFVEVGKNLFVYVVVLLYFFISVCRLLVVLKIVVLMVKYVMLMLIINFVVSVGVSVGCLV